MTTCSVEKTSWLRYLAPLLDPEVSRVYVNLSEDTRIEYDEQWHSQGGGGGGKRGICPPPFFQDYYYYYF